MILKIEICTGYLFQKEQLVNLKNNEKARSDIAKWKLFTEIPLLILNWKNLVLFHTAKQMIIRVDLLFDYDSGSRPNWKDFGRSDEELEVNRSMTVHDK